jgi:hypothetical protein
VADHNITFEQIDAAVNKFDFAAHHATVAKLGPAGAQNPALALPQLCPLYKTIVRPILVVLSNLPLIPQKWKDAIKAFIAVVDVLCP